MRQWILEPLSFHPACYDHLKELLLDLCTLLVKVREHFGMRHGAYDEEISLELQILPFINSINFSWLLLA